MGAPNLWNRKKGGWRRELNIKWDAQLQQPAHEPCEAAEPSEMAPEVAFVVPEVPGSRGCGPRRSFWGSIVPQAAPTKCSREGPGPPAAIPRPVGRGNLARAGGEIQKKRTSLSIIFSYPSLVHVIQLFCRTAVQSYSPSVYSCTVMTVLYSTAAAVLYYSHDSRDT